MSSSDVYKSKDWIAEKAFIKNDDYKAMYEHSISKPDEFWFEQGQRLDWFTPILRLETTHMKRMIYISNGMKMVNSTHHTIASTGIWKKC